jgi:hypothetical protein
VILPEPLATLPGLANAGHLPPYLNGQAVEIEGSLPLGIIEDVAFSMIQFRFTEGVSRLMPNSRASATFEPPLATRRARR